MWAQLVTSCCALEGQLQALRKEHEVLKLESQALRRCLDRAGVLPAQDIEQELKLCGADALVAATTPTPPQILGLAAEAKQRAEAIAEVEQALRPTPSTNSSTMPTMRRSSTPRGDAGAGASPAGSAQPQATRRSTSLRGPSPRRGSAAPEDSPRRPVILGGGRRPGNLNSASAPRLGEDGPQPTQAEEPDERSLNQVLEPFLDGSGPADEQQQVRTLQRFLKASPDPLNTWAGSGGPVSAVARAGRPDLARLLLRAKANVNDSDAKGVTALHIAAFDGNAEVCKVLLSARADVDATDRHGQTPLFFAPAREICRLLVERKAEVSTLNRKGQSALHLAGRAGFQEVLSWLSARAGKQIVELRDHHGNTARMYGQQALAAAALVPSAGTASQAELAAKLPLKAPQAATPAIPRVAALPSTSSLVEEPAASLQAGAQEFTLFQEPEEFSIATGVNTTPRARCRDDESGSIDGPRKGDELCAAAALEAAAQVASAAVAAAAATTWGDLLPSAHTVEPLAAQELPHKLDEVLDECW